MPQLPVSVCSSTSRSSAGPTASNQPGRTMVYGAPLARTSRSDRRFHSSNWPVLPPVAPWRLTPIEVISASRAIRPSSARSTAATPP